MCKFYIDNLGAFVFLNQEEKKKYLREFECREVLDEENVKTPSDECHYEGVFKSVES